MLRLLDAQDDRSCSAQELSHPTVRFFVSRRSRQEKVELFENGSKKSHFNVVPFVQSSLGSFGIMERGAISRARNITFGADTFTEPSIPAKEVSCDFTHCAPPR